MKNYILLIIIILNSVLCANSQSNTIDIRSNSEVNNELNNLSDSIDILKKQIEEIDILKKQIEELSNKVEGLLEKDDQIQDQLSQKLNSEELLLLKDDLSSKLFSNKDLINTLEVDLKSEILNLQNTTDTKLVDTDSKLSRQSSELIQTKEKNKENFTMTIVLLILLVLLFLASMIIYKMSSSNRSNITAAKEEIKDILKLDNSLKDLLEKQNDLIESSKESGSDEDILKSVKMVADEIASMENNIYQMDKGTRGLNRIERSIKNLRNNFHVMGYQIPILLDTEVYEGMNIEISSEEEDLNLEKGKKIITRIIKPRIDFKGEMIQRAKVEIKYNI